MTKKGKGELLQAIRLGDLRPSKAERSGSPADPRHALLAGGCPDGQQLMGAQEARFQGVCKGGASALGRGGLWAVCPGAE